MKTEKMKIAGAAALLIVSATACQRSKPNFVYMPDMAYSPAVKAQEEGAMRVPVEGTVDRKASIYPYKGDPEAAASHKNPLKRTKVVLKRGQELFNIYCIVCHGKYGEGDGNVVPKFPRPPSLQSDKVRTWPDGRIFHVMTEGQNLMPSYASQLPHWEDRWAIVHYVRVLQRAKNPTPEDTKALENW